jgi:hypothetical protein
MAKKADLSKFTFAEWFALVWFCIDAFTHLTIEFGYVCLALTTTARKSDTYLGWIWREYGRADARWAVRDVNVISLEILTVFCWSVVHLSGICRGHKSIISPPFANGHLRRRAVWWLDDLCP